MLDKRQRTVVFIVSSMESINVLHVHVLYEMKPAT